MGDGTNDARRISGVERAFGIIDYLLDNDQATLDELAGSLGLAKSTVHTYAATLLDQGYVIQRDNVYYPSLRFLEVGEQVRSKIDYLDIIRTQLREIIKQTGGITWFIVEEDGYAVFVEKDTSEDAVQPYGSIGKRTTLHDIAGGKAILAHLPESRIDEIISSRGLLKKTEDTITETGALFNELETIRSQGYAINDGENLQGWRAVASPILHDDRVLGSIAVSGPKHRMDGDRFTDEIPELVTAATNEIQLQILSE
jgi:DNA-binding IclR family transcriptional regulator